LKTIGRFRRAFAVMNSSSLARKGWMRFYEYFAHPGDQKNVAGNALYCANTIKNAAKEASLGCGNALLCVTPRLPL
jgi:hypothetical protein